MDPRVDPILQHEGVSPPTSEALGALHPELELGATQGIGAWSYGYYRLGYEAALDPSYTRKAAGILAVKLGLIANGFGAGIDLSVRRFGRAAKLRTIDFQRSKGLVADGVLGPTTARYLWRVYAQQAEQSAAIPNHYLGRLATGESANDPVAEGVVDPDDEGLLQFHLPYWPDVSIAEAWDPEFVFERAAVKFVGNRSSTGSWKAALAAWNIGATYARQWRLAGYPDSGGPSMGTDAAGNEIDAYRRAANYVSYVEALPY